MFLIKAAVVLGLLNATAIKAQNYLQETYPATVIEDALIDTAQLLKKYKYPSQTHFVTTEDNYILCVHRIARPRAPAVLLMHGVEDSSATWIMLGPWSGLGYYLYENGYDVWMGNARGNRYSRNHTIYDPDMNKSFWTFSWHEIGHYDLPAMIDYVLEQTAQSKIAYFGHSQGTTVFFVMASTRPEYNNKITVMNALAPVAFMKNIKSPLLNLAKNFVNLSGDMVRELLPQTNLLLKSCFTSKSAADLCLETLNQIVGKDENFLNLTMLPVTFTHLPAGANLKQIRHYLQNIDSGRFCQYDYGPVENLKRYGKPHPVDYPLEKVRVPVGLYYTYNDYLSNEIDVQQLAKVLPNVVEDRLYPNRKWNHMAMIWHVDARRLAMPGMLAVLNKYTELQSKALSET